MAEDDDVVVITADGRRIRPVKSVTRAVDLLEVLGAEREPMGLTELAAAVGCSKTAAYNLVTTLELHGLVRRVADHRYALGWKLLELGEVVRASSSFGEAARAEVVTLSEETGETALLAVLDQETVMYVELVESRRSVPLSAVRGSRQMADVSAAGQVLLAFAPVARRRRLLDRLDRSGDDRLMQRLVAVADEGVAVVSGAGEVAIAAPVFDYSGEAVASIAVVGPESRLPDERVDALREVVRSSAEVVSGVLGGTDRRRVAPGA